MKPAGAGSVPRMRGLKYGVQIHLFHNPNKSLLCNVTERGQKRCPWIISDMKASFFLWTVMGRRSRRADGRGGEDGREDGEAERPGC